MFYIYPKNLLFIITHRCNAHCLMCNIWQDDKKDELPLGEIKKIFDQRLFSRLEAITFSGGEASLRTDFNDIAQYFLNSKKRLNNVMIATNGLSPQLVYQRVKKTLEYIAKNNFKIGLTVQISCDGVGKTADKVRGTPGAFEKINSLIDQLNALKQEYGNLKIKIFFLVLPQNIDELKRINDYAKQKNIGCQITHLFISSKYYQNDTNKDTLAFSEENTQKVIDFLEHQKTKGLVSYYYNDLVKSMYCGKDRNDDCGFLTPKNVFIEANGNVHLCMNSQEYRLGNIIIDPKKNFWRGKEYKRIRKLVIKNCCRHCKNNCGFSPKGLAINFFRSLLKI